MWGRAYEPSVRSSLLRTHSNSRRGATLLNIILHVYTARITHLRNRKLSKTLDYNLFQTEINVEKHALPPKLMRAQQTTIRHDT